MRSIIEFPTKDYPGQGTPAMSIIGDIVRKLSSSVNHLFQAARQAGPVEIQDQYYKFSNITEVTRMEI